MVCLYSAIEKGTEKETKFSIEEIAMERKLYLDKLIRRKNNGMIKVITGIRRSGKTYLLFELFYDHLIKSGILT